MICDKCKKFWEQCECDDLQKSESNAALVARLTKERDEARQAEEIALANASGLRRWQERILSAAEKVFGEQSRRFKLSLRKNGTATNVFPDWLDGAWVAFQRAEDDGHVGLVAQIDHLKGLLLWTLYHHQGGSSDIGQPIRRALGIGQHDHLTPAQIEAAKAAAGLPQNA